MFRGGSEASMAGTAEGSLVSEASCPDFEAVFEEHAAFVGRALRHFGVDPADVEDVCQEVFLVVHRRLGDFDGRVALRTWIYGIAWKTAANCGRKRARRR